MSCNDVILYTCFSFQGYSVVSHIRRTRLDAEIYLGLPFVVSVSRRDFKVIFVLILVIV